MRRLLLLACLAMTACDNGNGLRPLPDKDIPMKSLAAIKDNLAFTCKHETLTPGSADSDVLFQYARWLEKNNQLKQDPDTDLEISRLYRIATENGHTKANINLQNGSLRGKYKLRGYEHLRFSQDLIDANVATGYYFVSLFLKNGIADLKPDMEMSLRFLRKAADEGSAQAQYEIGDALAPSSRAPDVARQMRRCAAEQGHGDAALELAVNLQGRRQYRDALEAFQLGVAAGDETSAGWL
ncbi:MAG: sel1 repeat family protein, partial [Pseudomonas sp.]